MSITKSELAITQLAHLDAVPKQARVVLSFEETQGVRVAAWATAKFGASVLLERVVDRYNQHPKTDEHGRPVNIYDTGDQTHRYQLEEAEDIGTDVAEDLSRAMKRLERGYPLRSVTVHGAEDAAAVIGSLERAVEVHPDNLNDSEHYMQAAAGYMLEHMQVMDSRPDKSISYLI
jgi:hypothetical protein